MQKRNFHIICQTVQMKEKAVMVDPKISAFLDPTHTKGTSSTAYAVEVIDQIQNLYL